MADLHHLWSDSEPEVDTVGIYVENHLGRCREFFIWIQLGTLPLAEGEGVRSTLLQGTLEIHQKSSEIYVLEIQAGHVGRLAEASGVTRDDI